MNNNKQRKSILERSPARSFDLSPFLRLANAEITEDELDDGSISKSAKEVFLIVYTAEGVGLAPPPSRLQQASHGLQPIRRQDQMVGQGRHGQSQNNNLFRSYGYRYRLPTICGVNERSKLCTNQLMVS
jgi:hypothetical protein